MSETMEYVPFHRPSIGEEEIEAVVRVLRSGWLTTGPEAQALEQEFAAFIGAPHALALNSCTAALHLALAVLDLQPGDEVLVPTMTFAASAEVVCYCGAIPVLCDVLPTLNLDPAEIDRRVTPRTRAVIVVHMAGQPADLDSIRAAAARHNLVVIEDAAHSLPARFRGELIGRSSELACFSFYATKNLTTGEGGMLTTTNPAWAERARSLALHGISKNAWNRYTASGSWYYEILEPGYKYNLTDLQAALGRVQLRRQNELWAVRRRLVSRYRELLAGVPGIGWPALHPAAESAWHLCVLLLGEESACPRDEVIAELQRAGIGTSVHFIPLHMHPYYRQRFGYVPEALPAAAAYYRAAVSLPLYPALSDSDQERIASVVGRAVTHG